MADLQKNIEAEKAALEKSSQAPKSGPSPRGLDKSRQNIAGTLESGESGEGGGKFVEGSENVSESASEGKERKGDASAQGKKDDGNMRDDQSSGTSFTFDEGNLPPAPKMIQLIEKQLRSEIHHLEKQAKVYKGGFFRKADYSKYSETVSEIREKNILLRKLVHYASDALKKLFLKMFGAQ